MIFRKIKSTYRSLISHHWEIGILNNSLDDIVRNCPLDFRLVTHDFIDRWFADPFILDVNEDEIVLFVEECSKEEPKGRISQIRINRHTCHIEERKIVLECHGHLSFPAIIRKENNVFIYPENSADGTLDMYKYNRNIESFVFVRTICAEPLTDAVCLSLDNSLSFGGLYIFSTDIYNPNGNKLKVFRENIDKTKFELCQTISFENNIARMAGDFFSIGDSIYRPAQDCTACYGNCISIQKMDIDKNGKFIFKEIRKLMSPHKTLNIGMHTINSYKGVVIVDVKGFRHPTIAPILIWLNNKIRALKSGYKKQ